MIRIAPVSECELLITLGERIDTGLAEQTGRYGEIIRQSFGSELIEVIPSYTTIFIQYHPLKTDFDSLHHKLQQLLGKSFRENSESKLDALILPVFYSSQTGPDLENIADQHNITVEEVIERHSRQEYTVCAIGFAPGFAFLASVDPIIATPRRATSRVKVPAGSVGIADTQTAVYPAETPGGWNIIGNCPVSLFSPNSQPVSPFIVGRKVRFKPVDQQEFVQLGGTLCPDWK
ncbi:5-oxoprolinase subunit PxpB [Spongorhabdus nitratireducens]